MELIYFHSSEELWHWLDENHQRTPEIWVGIYKSGSRRRGILYREVVETMAAFGWVEGIRKSIDTDSYKMRFCPRKPNSIWSVKNVELAEALIREGKMHPSGVAIYQARNPEKTELYAHEREDPVLPPEFQERLEAEPEAWEFVQGLPPSVRKVSLWWVVKAKRPATREKRFAILLESSREGLRIPPIRKEGD